MEIRPLFKEIYLMLVFIEVSVFEMYPLEFKLKKLESILQIYFYHLVFQNQNGHPYDLKKKDIKHCLTIDMYIYSLKKEKKLFILFYKKRQKLPEIKGVVEDSY
mgnify:CR=1 FL=1